MAYALIWDSYMKYVGWQVRGIDQRKLANVGQREMIDYVWKGDKYLDFSNFALIYEKSCLPYLLPDNFNFIIPLEQ